MKKFVAILLALVLCLSMSVLAFADGSPVAGPTVDNVPVVIAGEDGEAVELTEEQTAQVEAAFAAMAEDEETKDLTPVAVTLVEASADSPVEVSIELDEDAVVLLYDKNGKLLKKITAAEIAAMDGKLVLTESCTVVIAK